MSNLQTTIYEYLEERADMLEKQARRIKGKPFDAIRKKYPSDIVKDQMDMMINSMRKTFNK